MKNILIVGRKFSSLTNYLDGHGYHYTYLRDARLTNDGTKDNNDRITVDFSDNKHILEALAKIEYPIDGVVTTYENYVLTTALIANQLGLPGMPIEAAEACTDKNLMRQRFSMAPQQISPDFMLIECEQDVIDFSQKHGFPLIIKPTNLAKSLLVTKSDNLNELLANYHKAIKLLGKVYEKYAPNRTPRLIIEEFLDGSIHSVDAFVGNDGAPQVLDQVVDYQTGYDIGFDDNFHYSRILPSKLSSTDQQRVRDCAAMGITALGMKNSPAHVEIILTKQGPRVVEIGARNGGYRERMHSIANGIDLIGAGLEVAMGHKPSIKALRNDSIAVLELFPKTDGNFKELRNEVKVRELASTHYISVKAIKGDKIGKSSDGYKAAAIIILHNPDVEQFEKDLDFVNRSVSVLIG